MCPGDKSSAFPVTDFVKIETCSDNGWANSIRHFRRSIISEFGIYEPSVDVSGNKAQMWSFRADGMLYYTKQDMAKLMAGEETGV